MIELIAAAVTGAVVGYVGAGMVWQKLVKAQKGLIAKQGDVLDHVEATRDMAITTLTALRSNCFIPDERGVKVRYLQASVERRVKAETPRADKV